MKRVKYNPVARFMREGETGWKATAKVHNPKKAYKRDKRAGLREI